MKVNILDSGVFPILRIENFLSDVDYQVVKKDVKSEVMKLQELKDSGTKNDPLDDMSGRDYNRVYIDALYGKDRSKSETLMIIDKNLFSDEMLDIYNSIPETSYRLIKDSVNHETEITIYGDESKYNWHNDSLYSRIINFVLIIDLGMKFEGGHTHITNTEFDSIGERALYEGGLDLDADIDIEPKGNQLVMMPMWVTHRVTPIKMKSTKMIEGRITVNGHIGMKNIPWKRDEPISSDIWNY